MQILIIIGTRIPELSVKVEEIYSWRWINIAFEAHNSGKPSTLLQMQNVEKSNRSKENFPNHLWTIQNNTFLSIFLTRL